MAVDSYTSYKSYNAELDLQYLQDGWELDDEEAENVHDSRKRAFMFMLDIVREDNLPGKLALNGYPVTSDRQVFRRISLRTLQEHHVQRWRSYGIPRLSCQGTRGLQG